MTDQIRRILEDRGPCLSSTLAQDLAARTGISLEAARQRVHRSEGVSRLKGIPFERNARFTYLDNQYGTAGFWSALTKALLENSKAYGPALAALRARAGVMPRAHFESASGAPVRQKGHVGAETVLERLKTANLIREFEIPGIGPCVALSQGSDISSGSVSRLKARLVAEQVLLQAVHNWVRNLGVGSSARIELRGAGDKLPQVGTFCWDVAAPSYLAPLRADRKGQRPHPGFFVCDVLLGQAMTLESIAPFLHKCATLSMLKKVGRTLHMFVASEYSPEAFQKLREIGAVPATVENLFGRELAAAFTELIQVLSKAAAQLTDVEKFVELFTRLTQIEGALGAMRGAFFEMITAEVLRRRFPNAQVSMNLLVHTEEGSAEIDVLVRSNRDLVAVECKAPRPGGTVDDEEVEKWLHRRLPVVRRFAERQFDLRDMRQHFLLWTTGRLTENARTAVRQFNELRRPNMYELHVLEGDEVLAEAQRADATELVSLLKRHYLPLDDRNERATRST
jgi:hypothetical protein